ncbi:MAG: hypothetical protein HON90_16385, partial [Halobacteriovoraceae bacterium]|nr:hypothetical protein [Halobacteriovoraceae bacterium]
SVLPLVDPAAVLNLHERELKTLFADNSILEVVVVRIQDKRFGFIVHQLDEIMESSEKINNDTISNEGLKGSVYINNRTVSIIDIDFIKDKYEANKILIDKHVIDVFEQDDLCEDDLYKDAA